MFDTIALVTASILIAPGIFMAIVPMLPALSYMFVVALAFAAFDGFSSLSGGELLVLLAVVVVSIAVDHTSGLLGAKYGGAHAKSLAWGLLGSIVGTILMPPFGGLVGLFIGVLGAESYYKKSKSDALKAASSALVGTALGIAANIFLAITFLGLFLYFVLR